MCGQPAKWEVKVDDDLQFCRQGTFKPVCVRHKRHISLDQPPYVRRAVPQSLNEAYINQTRAVTFARCDICHSVFMDDVWLYGSLKCPNRECRGAALRRGIETLDED